MAVETVTEQRAIDLEFGRIVRGFTAHSDAGVTVIWPSAHNPHMVKVDTIWGDSFLLEFARGKREKVLDMTLGELWEKSVFPVVYLTRFLLSLSKKGRPVVPAKVPNHVTFPCLVGEKTAEFPLKRGMLRVTVLKCAMPCDLNTVELALNSPSKDILGQCSR